MTPYFAYGSNLSIEQMLARTGPFPIGFEPPRIARLPGYRLAFNMQGESGQVYANIVRPGECVRGVIYFLIPNALDKLDAFEHGYHRERIIVFGNAGEAVEAVTYVADAENAIDGGSPSAEYVQRILRGGRHHGLPDAYLREIEALAAR